MLEVEEQSREDADFIREVPHPPNPHPFSQNSPLQHRKVYLQAENVPQLHNLGYLKSKFFVISTGSEEES